MIKEVNILMFFLCSILRFIKKNIFGVLDRVYFDTGKITFIAGRILKLKYEKYYKQER
jgi:hypothetical protein